MEGSLRETDLLQVEETGVQVFLRGGGGGGVNVWWGERHVGWKAVKKICSL